MSDTTSIVIFGASGDLTKRKLVPALFSLFCKDRLPEDFQLIGMARTDYDSEAFRNQMKSAMQEFAPAKFIEDEWDRFAEKVHYVCGDFGEEHARVELRERLRATEEANGGRANRLFYLATPPSVYESALVGLGETGLAQQDRGWRRVVIEKPFGRDLASAHHLNEVAHQVLDEEQVYRIDHYLAKETVQNLLVFRFANSIFEPVWNRLYIDHVQITVAESVDVGHRGRFYDGVGVMRDMFQNHILQLLSLVAMEPPASFNSNDIRNERVKVLRSLRPMRKREVAENSVRGQYRGYLDDPGVAEESKTATYAALRLFIDNWRWTGVPFYLRSGKALAGKTTEILIQFRSVPHLMFPMEPGEQIRPNQLELCIQPDEGMHLRFEAKVPDTNATMRSVDMEFHYADAFGPGAIPDAYERLLLDALNGDPSLFTRADTIELAWGLIDNILAAWESDPQPPLAIYEPNTWGPKEADEFIAADGRAWELGCAGRRS